MEPPETAVEVVGGDAAPPAQEVFDPAVGLLTVWMCPVPRTRSAAEALMLR